jgi:hypothetical protein
MYEAGITQARVAAEAGVTRFLVSHVLAGRAKSRNVVETAERLLSLSESCNSHNGKILSGMVTHV